MDNETPQQGQQNSGDKTEQVNHIPVTPPAKQPVTNLSPVNPGPTVVSVSPTATNSPTSVINNADPQTTNYLTGSQVEQVKKPLHWGIYVIVGLNLIGFLLSFFSSSQSNIIYTIAAFIDLAVAIGLLLRLEIARKIMVVLGGIVIVLYAIIIILLVVLQHRVNQLDKNANNALNSINQQQLTPQLQVELAEQKTTISNDQKELGKALGLTYIKFGATIIESAVVIIYLTRPKIKEQFVELQK